ncbi:hypothetical protein [Thiothrix lacustris]|uniref:hypothetical protein n=1 Tax=Thiothrix lacustris TaxID=525917 RepID=UPI0012EB1524|nr:hypothetical protein [Thiothrix lacustris]
MANLLPPVFAKDTGIAAFPVPVGRVYHSGRSDVSTEADSLLFESSAEALLKRRKV